MQFEVGDKAVVPALGVGIVKEISDIELEGQQLLLRESVLWTA